MLCLLLTNGLINLESYDLKKFVDWFNSFVEALINTNIYLSQIFINNEYVNSESGKVFATINPTTGEKIADIQEGDQVSSSVSFEFQFNNKWYSGSI